MTKEKKNVEVTLRKMTEEEFGAFADMSIERQAKDLAEDEDIPMEDALDEAEEDFRDMLPYGQDTEDNFLCTVLDGAGNRVGDVWYSFDETEGMKQCFLCDLVLGEVDMRNGLGSAALAAMETLAADAGCEESVLFVLNKQRAAKKLYEECGYERIGSADGGVYMKKDL